MNNKQWLTDKKKNGEIYSNTTCFTWCLKFFEEGNRIEAWGTNWGMTKGYYKEFPNEKEALFTYRVIKGLEVKQISKFLKQQFKKI